MCGRFFRHEVSWEEYWTGLNLIRPDGVEAPAATYNAAPMSIQPVLRLAEGDKSAVELAPLVWGLIPSWWNKPLSEKKFSTFNAKCETMADKASFRGAFRHRRCLVPMSGWFEWQAAPTPKGKKTPYAVGLKDSGLFFCAGLWDSALIDGSEIHTFTVITTRANQALSHLHPRMPVIVDPADFEAWLNPVNRLDESFFTPWPETETEFWPANPSVGNVRNNSPDYLQAMPGSLI